MTRLLTIILLLFIITIVHSQDIRRHEADSLVKLLGKSKPDTSRVNLLLRLSEYHIFKPGENKIDLDSAAVRIDQAKLLIDGTKRKGSYGYQFLVESYLAKERGQIQTGRELAKKAIAFLNDDKDHFHLAQACLALSYYYAANDPLQVLEKIRLLKQATFLFQKSDAVKQTANTLQLLAEVYTIQGDNDGALVNLKRSLDAYKSISYKHLQGVYIEFGDIYFRKADYPQALAYYLKALKTAEDLRDTSAQLCQVYNRIGKIYITMGDWEKSIQYLKYGLDIAERLNNNSDVLTIVFNSMSAYNKFDPAKGLAFLKSIPRKYTVIDKPGLDFVIPMLYLSSYISLNQYSQGQPYVDQLVSMTDRYKSDEGTLYNIYKILTNYYYGSKQYVKARFYLVKNSELLLTMNDPYRSSLNYALMFKLDSAEGNYKSALENLLVYNKLHDSIYNETKSRQIKEIEALYKTEKKEQELRLKDNDIMLEKQHVLLLTRQSELQQKDFEQSRLRFEFDSSSNAQSLRLLNLEAVRKDNNLRLRKKDISLLENKSLLQQIKLNETRTTRNFIVAAALMLLVLLGLGYNRYALKQKANRQINGKNIALQQAITEKEWLLKEVHHRVKNNLQIIISLLNAQSNYLESDAAIKAIRESQQRMNAISLIHQKLYRSEDTAFINIREYVNDLVHHIKRGFSYSQKIVFDLNISDTQMDLAQAVPLGLILNEAVSNSVKYAFPEKCPGLISISIQHSLVDDSYLLTVEDNGVGFPSDYDPSKKASFGIRLMQGLSKQLHGSFKIESNNGVHMEVAFSDTKISKLIRKEQFKSIYQEA